MSELTLTLLRLGLLALLWIFIFGVVGVMRTDIYGTQVSRRTQRKAMRQQEKAQEKAHEKAQGKGKAGAPARAGAAGAAAGPLAGAAAGAVTSPVAVDEQGAGKGRGRGRRRSATPTTLVVTEGPLAGTSLPLRGAGILIGRNPECALVLDDDYASGRHCRVYQGSTGWMVEDLGSTNGTFIGRDRLTAPVPVEVGTSLRIGKTVLELRG